MKQKVRNHCRILCTKVPVEGLMAWRDVSLGIRRAGVPVQSGNVPVERLWSILESMMPPAVKNVSLRWFIVLAMFMFLRHNYAHFRATGRGGVVCGDPLMAQRLETFQELVRVVSENASTDHLQALFDPFEDNGTCLLYTSPSPRDATLSRMPSSA